nr:hypothetical protein CFP56_68779 [Quercus suber]
MAEQDKAVEEAERVEQVEEVPEELRLAYREDLGKADGGAKKTTDAQTPHAEAPVSSASLGSVPIAVTQQAPAPATSATPVAPRAGLPPQQAPQALQARGNPALDDGVPGWIDKAIFGVAAALIRLGLSRDDFWNTISALDLGRSASTYSADCIGSPDVVASLELVGYRSYLGGRTMPLLEILAFVLGAPYHGHLSISEVCRPLSQKDSSEKKLTGNSAEVQSMLSSNTDLLCVDRKIVSQMIAITYSISRFQRGFPLQHYLMKSLRAHRRYGVINSMLSTPARAIVGRARHVYGSRLCMESSRPGRA